jgi:large subunit ribosomal protein L35
VSKKMKTKKYKIKTLSGAKKRFKITANGKVKAGHCAKRHGMIKRTPKFVRNSSGMRVLSKAETDRIRQMLPYA